MPHRYGHASVSMLCIIQFGMVPFPALSQPRVSVTEDGTEYSMVLGSHRAREKIRVRKAFNLPPERVVISRTGQSDECR